MALRLRGVKEKKNLSRWGDEWFIFLFYSLKPQSQVWIFVLNFRAQNNFRTVARHDQINFSLVKSFFWLVKNIEKKVNLSFRNFLLIWERNCILQSWLFVRLCDRSTWLVSEAFGQSNCHSARTLSVDQPLFWALNWDLF